MGAQLFWAFLAAALPCLLAIGFLLERQARRALDAEMTLRVEALATTVRAAISPAAWEGLMRLEPGEDQSRTAQSLRQRLEGIRREIAADWLGVWSPEGQVLIETSGRYRLGDVPARAALLDRELGQVRAGAVASSPLLRSESGRFVKIGLAGISLSTPATVPDELTPAAERTGLAPPPEAVILVSAESGSLEAIGGMRRTMVGIALLGTLLLMAVAVLLARRLNRRLRLLAAAAGDIGRGSLERPVPDLGGDEIGVLARTLEQMRSAVRDRERELRAMLGGVAHEIRNPLGGLILSSEMLSRDQSLGERQRRQAGRILAEGERLERVVSSFLQFARPKEPSPGIVRIGPLVRECIENAALGLSFEGQTGQDGPELSVWCDPDHLRQMVLNLVRNAMQAAGPSGHLAVSWRMKETPAGHAVRLEIADNGPGIAPDLRAIVFEPFQTGRAKGAGLGLALVRQLAERNAVTVRIEDSRWGGAALILELPPAERPSTVRGG